MEQRLPDTYADAPAAGEIDAGPPLHPGMERRAAAFARLFEAVHEGVYIGTIGPDATSTIAANPHLKLIFGYASESPELDVRPFAQERFVDPQARVALLERLTTDGSVSDYLMRLRRADGNPMWVELTARADRPTDDSGLGIETLLSEAERAARIVRNLLTFARKRQTTRAMVDVNRVVRETLALRAYEQHVTNITVLDALAAGLPNVFADGHQVQQVLLNLVINAEQAMLSAHGRGVLVVRTWHDPDQESVVLEINDDGPGIPNNLQPKIFDPFFTTKEVGKGTGLGLTVAYAIVQEHGGRIRLESRPNAGASFYVELPVTGTKLQPALEARGRLQAPVDAVAGASILVVEDEAKLANAVVDALQDAGYLVEHASDGEEGLNRVGARAFDLVICDLKMPRMDGKAFYRMLAAAAPGLSRHVIFVTGDVAGTDAETFLEESGCRWLEKPFRLGDLLRAVRDGLA